MKFDHDDRSPIKMITALKERRVSSRKSIRRLFVQRIIDPSNGNPNLQRNFNTRRKDKFVISTPFTQTCGSLIAVTMPKLESLILWRPIAY